MKKNIYLFFIACMYALVSCTDNPQEKADIDITACGIHNPEWLLAEVKNVIKKTESYRAILVYSIQYNAQEYILICDQMNSSIVDGNLLYTCNGQLVNPQESLYKDLLSFFNENTHELLWSN